MENVMMLTRTWFVRSDRTNRKMSSLGRIIVTGRPSFFCLSVASFTAIESVAGDHDMSWLRLQRTESHGGREVSYSFGADSFVKRFFWEFTGHGVCHDDGRPGQRYLDGEHRVSAWRISTGRTRGTQQNRVIYRAVQCHDADGPMLAPDLLQGNEFDTCPHDYLAAEYQLRLASSSSAKRDGRHYVGGYLHYRLPASCWMIDADETHLVA